MDKISYRLNAQPHAAFPHELRHRRTNSLVARVRGDQDAINIEIAVNAHDTLLAALEKIAALSVVDPEASLVAIAEAKSALRILDIG